MKGCDTCFEGDTPICVIVRSLGITEVVCINNDSVRKIKTILDISSVWFNTENISHCQNKEVK